MSDLKALLPQADFIALTCPLTAETEKLIDADALGRVKPSAYLLNAARGRVVDEPALVDALARRQIRGAALDVMVEEPLPAASPLWVMEHVLITPHPAGRLPLRGECARDHAGESRAALARRDRAAEPSGLDDRHCERPQFHSRGGWQKRGRRALELYPGNRGQGLSPPTRGVLSGPFPSQTPVPPGNTY